MPPTDEEYLATARHAMMALEAQLYRSLGGPSPSRDQALAIAREMRDIVKRATAAVGVDGAEEIVEYYERAGKRVIRELSTSAWDEPETVEQAAARMGRLPAAPGPGVLDRVNERERPLTDEVLTEIESLASHDVRHKRTPHAKMIFDPAEAIRLVAEVRRLRSDDWLERAMLEAAPGNEERQRLARDLCLAILRKHRDGKA